MGWNLRVGSTQRRPYPGQAHSWALGCRRASRGMDRGFHVGAAGCSRVRAARDPRERARLRSVRPNLRLSRPAIRDPTTPLPDALRVFAIQCPPAACAAAMTSAAGFKRRASKNHRSVDKPWSAVCPTRRRSTRRRSRRSSSPTRARRAPGFVVRATSATKASPRRRAARRGRALLQASIAPVLLPFRQRVVLNAVLAAVTFQLTRGARSSRFVGGSQLSRSWPSGLAIAYSCGTPVPPDLATTARGATVETDSGTGAPAA